MPSGLAVVTADVRIEILIVVGLLYKCVLSVGVAVVLVVVVGLEW